MEEFFILGLKITSGKLDPLEDRYKNSRLGLTEPVYYKYLPDQWMIKYQLLAYWKLPAVWQTV